MPFPKDMSGESQSESESDETQSEESQSSSDAPSDLKKGPKPNPLRRWAQQ
jgi:hypothetical protein